MVSYSLSSSVPTPEGEARAGWGCQDALSPPAATPALCSGAEVTLTNPSLASHPQTSGSRRFPQAGSSQPELQHHSAFTIK